MRSNPDQTLAEYRASMRPRPSAKIARHRERPFDHVPTYPSVTQEAQEYADENWRSGRHGLPALAPALRMAGGSFVTEMRAFMAASSPEEIATAIRDLFTDQDAELICRLVRYGTAPETETPLHHLNGEAYTIDS